MVVGSVRGLEETGDAPCDSFDVSATCGYECKAFTMWIDKGNYLDGTVGVFKKTAKKVA